MSKGPVSEGTMYLHQCITHSDCKVDYNAVAGALGINAGAANKRMARLKDRIKNQGVAGGKAWTGELDQDATFLFQCITSSNCRIDFKKVAAAVKINASAAQKRFTRLKAKYTSSVTNNPAPAAAPVAKQPPSNLKRKVEETKSESDSDEDKNPAKKAAIVKEEYSERSGDSDDSNDPEVEADVETQPDATSNTQQQMLAQKTGVKTGVKEAASPRKLQVTHDTSSESRKTRGKKIDLKKIFRDSESDDETPKIPNYDGPADVDYDDSSSEASVGEDSDNDWGAEDSDSSSEGPTKKRARVATPASAPKKTPRRAQTSRTATPAKTKIAKSPRRIISPNTPVGLSGLKVLKSHRSAQVAKTSLPSPAQVVKKSLPFPTQAVSAGSSDSSSKGSSESFSEGSDRSVDLSVSAAPSKDSSKGPITKINNGNDIPSPKIYLKFSRAPSEAVSARSVYVSAAGSLAASTSDNEEDRVGDDDGPGLQLQADLDKHVEQWCSEVQDSEDVMPSIEEDIKAPGTGLLNRVFSWWK